MKLLYIGMTTWTPLYRDSYNRPLLGQGQPPLMSTTVTRYSYGDEGIQYESLMQPTGLQLYLNR